MCGLAHHPMVTVAIRIQKGINLMSIAEKIMIDHESRMLSFCEPNANRSYLA